MTPVERHIRVPRTARVFEVGSIGPATREIWVGCHGYGQLAEPFARALEPLVDETRLVLAPEGLSRFYLDDPAKRHGPDSLVGASWMTREDRETEITDYVEYLDRLVEVVQEKLERNDARVVALGFSQGVATVCRWAALGKTSIERLILWGGPVPTDLPTERSDQVFRGAAVTLVSGLADRLVTPKVLERERLALADRGIHAELLTHDGGHSLNSKLLRALATAPSSSSGA